MEDCRRVFRNISEILDCVGCDKCKLHAKLEFLGLGTALKILFTKDALTVDFLQRNELIALIVTLGKYSDAVKFITEMEAIIASKNRKELIQSIYIPTLIIHGDIDPLIKVRNAYTANKLIQSSELEIVSGMGHMLDEESYAKFQNQFISFLNK